MSLSLSSINNQGGDGFQKLKKPKSKSKMQNFKKIMKKGKSKFYHAFWGDSIETFNYVAETSMFVNFFTMQLFRIISFLVLFMCFGTYGYIYVRYAIFQYNFWALTITMLAFGTLFIGSGKQKVYQYLVGEKKEGNKKKKPKINYDDPKKKSNLWSWGVVLYA